jgi:Rad3-related DNA helicase
MDRLGERVPKSKNCLDIEEMVSQGRLNGICPYYKAKAELASADIVVLPYNYMINTQIREKLQL